MPTPGEVAEERPDALAGCLAPSHVEGEGPILDEELAAGLEDGEGGPVPGVEHEVTLGEPLQLEAAGLRSPADDLEAPRRVEAEGDCPAGGERPTEALSPPASDR